MTHFNDKLIRIDDRDSVIEFLQQPSVVLAEGLTAILANPWLLKLAAGRIVQAALKGRLLEQLGKELDELRKAGRIKEDYFATHKQQATLHELLKFIDENPPDDELFNALKSIFFCTVAVDSDSSQEQLGYFLLQLCKQLSSGEILLLKTSWKFYTNSPNYFKQFGSSPPSSIWLNRIGEEAKLPVDLILRFEQHLMQQNLLMNRSDGSSGPTNVENCRLTQLAIALCERITRFP